MEKLKELVGIINKNKVKSIEIIGKSNNSNTLIAKFYEALHDQKISSDEDALVFLYGEKSNKKAYYKLKHNLKERLLNTLFLVDVKNKKYSDRKQSYLECQKGLMALNFLLKEGVARKTAIWLAEKILKISIPWVFTEIILSTLRTLRSFHASKSGDRNKFQKYDQLITDYHALYNAELIVESKYTDILSFYVNDKSTKFHVYELASKHIEEIKTFEPKIKSAKFYYQSAMLKITKYMSVNDYRKTAGLCRQALNDIDSLGYKDNKAIVVISYQLIASCIQLKKYDEGKKHVQNILAVQDANTFNWFKTHELYLSLCFHAGDYKDALKVYSDIINNQKFKCLPQNIREVWKIYEAWLHLLYRMDKIEGLPAENELLKKFKVSRFINEMNILSKDKKGLNIPILIVHTVLLFMYNKEEMLYDRQGAISKYVYRYIDEKENQRSFYFMKILIAVIKNDFRKNEIELKTKKIYSQLQQTPIDRSRQSHDVEIIPYETVWCLILEILDMKNSSKAIF